MSMIPHNQSFIRRRVQFTYSGGASDHGYDSEEDGGPRKVLFIFFGAIAGFMILLCCLFYAVFRTNMQCFDFDQHQYEKALDQARAQLMAARDEDEDEHQAPQQTNANDRPKHSSRPHPPVSGLYQFKYNESDVVHSRMRLRFVKDEEQSSPIQQLGADASKSTKSLQSYPRLHVYKIMVTSDINNHTNPDLCDDQHGGYLYHESHATKATAYWIVHHLPTKRKSTERENPMLSLGTWDLSTHCFSGRWIYKDARQYFDPNTSGRYHDFSLDDLQPVMSTLLATSFASELDRYSS